MRRHRTRRQRGNGKAFLLAHQIGVEGVARGPSGPNLGVELDAPLLRVWRDAFGTWTGR